VVYAAVLAAICLQATGMILSATRLRRRRVPTGRFDPRFRTGAALACNLAWALLVLVLLPRQLGAPLSTLAHGLPDLAYALGASGVVALVWGVVRTSWAYFAFRNSRAEALPEPLAVT
jgi:hypothetical protein